MKMETSPSSLFTTLLAATLLVGMSVAQEPAGIDHLSQCIRMAEPLVQNPDFIFPLTKQDIKGVCGMWDGFVDCVYEYTTTYLSPTQQEDFNKAIESSIQSIHQLCVEDPDYQRKYMAYAPCMKRVSIESVFCGSQYRYLANLVQNSGTADSELCCAHQKFRKCVLDTTPLQCDAGGVAMGSGNSASQFMKDMLDRALGFLLQKCRESYIGSADCSSDNIVFPDDDILKPNSVGSSLSSSSSAFSASSSSSVPTRSPDSDTRRTPGTSKTEDRVTPKPVVPSLNLGGNFLGAESQEFQGSEAGKGTATLLLLVLTLLLALKL